MRFEVDPGKCTECGRCTTVCSLEKAGRIQPLAARIGIGRRWPEVPLIRVCRFESCPDHPCIDSCPFEAFSIREGKVLINEADCRGCRECLDACPYQAITFMENRNVAVKCDLCDGSPACVSECVTEALVWREE